MYSEKMRLDGEVTVVTGAGGGRLGTETAVALGEAGAHVVGVDISLAQMQETSQRIAAIGGKFVGIASDILQAESARELIGRIWAEHGPIQHYVHVVGGSRPCNLHNLDSFSDEEFDQVLAFILRPVYLLSHVEAS